MLPPCFASGVTSVPSRFLLTLQSFGAKNSFPRLPLFFRFLRRLLGFFCRLRRRLTLRFRSPFGATFRGPSFPRVAEGFQRGLLFDKSWIVQGRPCLEAFKHRLFGGGSSAETVGDSVVMFWRRRGGFRRRHGVALQRTRRAINLCSASEPLHDLKISRVTVAICCIGLEQTVS